MKEVAHVERILRLNPETPIGSKGLADDLKLSRYQLYRRVKAETGISPKKLAGRNRIEQACDLLRETSLPIAEVAAQVGIDDANYFARFFRQRTGVSPSTWRKRQHREVPQAQPVAVNRLERPKSADPMPIHLL